MENFENQSDENLVRLLKEERPRCDRAFNVLYQRHRKKLYSYCVFLCSNKDFASDIFQEAWMRFGIVAKEGKPVENVLPYLITTARNRFLYDKRKSSQRSCLVEIDSNVSPDDIMDFSFTVTGCENEELIALIKTAVNNLDEIYREAFVLKRYDELTYSEIAAIVGESVECVKSRVSRATIMVKDYLKVYMKELI